MPFSQTAYSQTPAIENIKTPFSAGRHKGSKQDNGHIVAIHKYLN